MSNLGRLLDLDAVFGAIERTEAHAPVGRVTRASGLIIEATLPQAALGTACDIDVGGQRTIAAEVVGFAESKALLMPVGDVRGIREGAIVIPKSQAVTVGVGSGLLGRIVDAMLQPIDGKPPIPPEMHVPIDVSAPAAMLRRRISRTMPTGVRAIDSFLPIGEGQRVAIMAGAGVGKSSLLGMLARSAQADIIVVGLIGERGREVREFVERDLGPRGLARSIVVVATGDAPPLVRIRAALSATAVAEHYRSQGLRVLLMMDSLTRVAMAQREVGLAAGEPPTSKGYPPSVFAILPRLVERAGNSEGKGSITALYTVLMEGDDMADPVADAAKAALDGHIILSRKLASSGHFPAIDILPSVSRVMNDIVDKNHQDLGRSGRDVLAAYKESSDLIEVGAYVSGTNPRVDRAIASMDGLNTFLRQDMEETSAWQTTLDRLRAVLAQGAAQASNLARAARQTGRMGPSGSNGNLPSLDENNPIAANNVAKVANAARATTTSTGNLSGSFAGNASNLHGGIPLGAAAVGSNAPHAAAGMINTAANRQGALQIAPVGSIRPV